MRRFLLVLFLLLGAVPVVFADASGLQDAYSQLLSARR